MLMNDNSEFDKSANERNRYNITFASVKAADMQVESCYM